jgi:hypothetical protein
MFTSEETLFDRALPRLETFRIHLKGCFYWTIEEVSARLWKHKGIYSKLLVEVANRFL